MAATAKFTLLRYQKVEGKVYHLWMKRGASLCCLLHKFYLCTPGVVRLRLKVSSAAAPFKFSGSGAAGLDFTVPIGQELPTCHREPIFVAVVFFSLFGCSNQLWLSQRKRGLGIAVTLSPSFWFPQRLGSKALPITNETNTLGASEELIRILVGVGLDSVTKVRSASSQPRPTVVIVQKRAVVRSNSEIPNS